MRSSKTTLLTATLLFLGLALTFLSGCSKDLTADDEYNIGNKLEAVTPLRADNGQQNATIVMFDEVLRKVHEFDVATLAKIRTLPVNNPGEKHYELHDPVGNYIIDLSLKGFTIFDTNSNAQNNPVQLQGQPRSAAFDPSSGYLVIYDDMMDVGVVSLSPTGQVLSAGGFGSSINGVTIASGDLVGAGQLVLALSDGTIATVNLAQSLTQGQWVYTVVPTSFSSGLSWVAAVPGFPQEILAKSGNYLELINFTNGQTISQSGQQNQFLKLSKTVNAHAISGDGQNISLLYTDGSTIQVRQMYKQDQVIMGSQLDLTNNIWVLVNGDAGYNFDIFSGDINIVKSNRSLRVYQPSSMFASANMDLPSSAQILLDTTFFFALQPSDLGDAFTQNYVTGQKLETKGFNLKEFDNPSKH